ncbi:hypothetical protein BCV69DRAFT_71032 [Microstroma glucosiphilum]|uniref:Secreted protein n=1 Tax=Pseudomicrostroma glucosiphilum TaxID=1684307 RepID=A0A316U0E5_9BASI|nr:hypothetical protein BCV69DRAFT_71032 [Pseudomicrostroma glucosiphilum]PWN18364.1 hypothetical protein BCV69DRAFT_71032 [Pseudomicrostroma glucosiphilum]
MATDLILLLLLSSSLVQTGEMSLLPNGEHCVPSRTAVLLIPRFGLPCDGGGVRNLVGNTYAALARHLHEDIAQSTSTLSSQLPQASTSPCCAYKAAVAPLRTLLDPSLRRLTTRRGAKPRRIGCIRDLRAAAATALIS